MQPRRTRIVVQARTSSKRLPGKVLLPIGGLPLALLCARRLGNRGEEVILATSTDPSDDLLEGMASEAGVPIFRGNLEDVLTRLVNCTKDLGERDLVVRATADNPFPDGEFVDELISAFEEKESEYLGTSSPEDGLPYGLSAEVCTVGALREAAEIDTEPSEREHVTIGLRRRSGAGGVVSPGRFLPRDHSNLRATIDTLQDYLSIAPLFSRASDPVEVEWRQLVEWLNASGPRRPRIPTKTARGVDFGSIMLGTAQLGTGYGIANRTGWPGDDEVREILRLAKTAGVTHVDTAREYGDAEDRIGRLEPEEGTDRFCVISKLRPFDDLPDDATDRRVRDAVDASVYGSCRDLRRDSLDVLMFHRSADMFRWGGTALTRLDTHRRRCVVGEFGVSVYTPDEAVRCLSEPSIEHLQIPLNVLDNRWLCAPFQEVLGRRRDVAIHARSVFLQGLLLSASDIWPGWTANPSKWIDRLEDLVGELGRKNRVDLCIAYVRAFPWVTSVVVGVETSDQLREILELAHAPPLTEKEAGEVRNAFEDVPKRLLDPSRWGENRV